MSREIKFRALCEVEYKEGSSKTIMVHFSHLELDNGLWFNPDDENIYHINEWLSKPMQFTGLQDKNGVDIYEGDILKRIGDEHTEEYSAFVRYSCREFTTVDYDLPFDHGCILDYKTTVIEVVGNIHQNKELTQTK